MLTVNTFGKFQITDGEAIIDDSNLNSIMLSKLLMYILLYRDKTLSTEDIVADIIAFVRQQAIGSALISHETRVKNAFAKLRQNHKFNKVQLDWLKRIEKVMLEEAVLDEQMFEQGAFKNNGGFKGIDRRFEGQLHEVIMELNQYLYDDGGIVA